MICSTGKTLIHINIDDGEIDKVYKADAAIVADAKPRDRRAQQGNLAERRGRGIEAGRGARL